MDKHYSYPIDLDWSKEDIEAVVNMWRMVELAYETGVDKDEFLANYTKFKRVIPAIGEEKKWSKEFEAISDYSLYRAVKEAKTTNKKKIHLSNK